MKMPSSEPDSQNFHQKYVCLKRKMKYLLYENECFQEELKKTQRKLLKVSRDKSFLLDRLLQYETVESSSSDSEATVSSESESEIKAELLSIKKKRTSVNTNETPETNTPSSSTNTVSNEAKKKKSRKTCATKPGSHPNARPPVLSSQVQLIPTVSTPDEERASQPVRRPGIEPWTSGTVVTCATPTTPAPPPAAPPPAEIPKSSAPAVAVKIETPVLNIGDGHMTSEEIERHLEAKQSLRDLIPEKTPLTVPVEMFSNEPSVMECEIIDGQVSEISPNTVVENVGIVIDIHD